MNKLISFCCLSYNHEKYIKQCITSIWNQKYENIEILVLDDGSQDNSLKILNELKSQSPYPMTIINQENCGNIGANFNKLASIAKGDLITFIACDDAYIDNSMSEYIDLFNKNDQLALVCHSKITYVNENNEELHNYPDLKLESIENPTVKDILELDYSELGSFYIQGGIFRKDIVDKIGGFDDDMICDDIILRTKYLRYLLDHPNYQIQVFNNSCVLYRRHANNISRNNLRQVNSVIEYFDRYWQDREPPKMLNMWIETALRDDTISYEQKLSIFLKNSYIFKILENKNYLTRINDEGYLQDLLEIPYIFSFYKYVNGKNKVRVIKIFNQTVLKWKKKKD